MRRPRPPAAALAAVAAAVKHYTTSTTPLAPPPAATTLPLPPSCDPSAGSPTETLLRLLSNLGPPARARPRLPRMPISDSDGRCVQRRGTLSPRAGDPRVLGIPRSARASSRASLRRLLCLRLSARPSRPHCSTRAARRFQGHHGPAIARLPPAARRPSPALCPARPADRAR